MAKKIINKYLSKVAQKIIPYQWEEGISEEMLRFDTNTFPFPPPSLKLFLKEMESNCPINEYSDPSYKKLKQLVADYENVKPEMISITNSGDEAIDVLGKTFLNPGDYFITTPPTYEVYSIQCEINKGRLLEMPLNQKDFTINGEGVINLVNKKRVKLVFLCNPNNPTTTVIPLDLIEKIIKKSDSIVVVDEVYREFYGETVVPMLSQNKNLVVLRSFSKFAALAGARVGYLIADPKVTEKFESIRFPMGVSYLSYKLAEFVLENCKEWMKDQIEMIIRERKRLIREFIKLGFYTFPSKTNFLLVKIGDKAAEICEKLKSKGIIIRDCSKKKYLTSCVRITIRNRKQNNILIKRLKEVL